jgi:hypothetical protein
MESIADVVDRHARLTPERTAFVCEHARLVWSG